MNRFRMDPKLKEMEDEMNRFEQEISVESMIIQSDIGSYGNRNPGMSGGPSLQFLPHQLQHNPDADYGASIGHMGMGVAHQNPVVIQASPAVYAAPPVKTVQPEPIVPQLVEVIPIPPVVVPKPIVKFSDMDISVPPPMIIPSIAKGGSSYATQDDQQSGKKNKKRKIIRTAGGQNWEDASLQEWETDDFRIFCGDLGNDVTDEVLTRAFSKYPSFLKAKVIRDKRNNKTKGFGFVSFRDPQDFIRAMREMNGKYVGSRPIKLRKSTWKDRNCEVVKKKMKEKQRLGLR